ncbi:uncharacterized protein PHALS_15430 [Plasmopara halstedii]|uniref:Uncharacterized protein n=1 Tax=Plasmopara halstedii TaxID=4781 RepID=A0A0P1AGU9_PLAHL|nr:uncharacterized protein PHALS_15430 [Plasmopara halstedii]CEG40169.1 hypothetical protein PHALS_15430 [Plasmopara halstedii]|eukprot:XP_024576538.1 hypothetical protein PHALS_15430 [Plasmopara halstedii]
MHRNQVDVIVSIPTCFLHRFAISACIDHMLSADKSHDLHIACLKKVIRNLSSAKISVQYPAA